MEVGDIVARDHGRAVEVFRVVSVDEFQILTVIPLVYGSLNSNWLPHPGPNLPYDETEIRLATSKEKEAVEMVERLGFLGAR